MLIKNPVRHFPTCTVKAIYTDGRVCGRSTTAEAEMIFIPGEEEDIRVIVLVALDEGNHPVTSKMWVDGIWGAYDEELLDQLEHPKQDEEVEEEIGEEEEEEEEVLSAIPIPWQFPRE